MWSICGRLVAAQRPRLLGRPGGPGPDPADEACETEGEVDVVAPAAKELRVRPKLPRID